MCRRGWTAAGKDHAAEHNHQGRGAAGVRHRREQRPAQNRVADARDGLQQDEAGKPARTFHSRFHAISRLEHGHWRVLTEYRTPAGPDAEQAWSAAFPMASVAATLKE